MHDQLPLELLFASRWRFAIQMLGEQHVVSVALGPPEDVVDAWGVSCHQSCPSCQSYHTVCTHHVFPASLKFRLPFCGVD